MPSSVASHTIPPFYACYFLRSLSSPGITYIGSTPAPPRRKRQHNGDLTQGAWKTTRSRPWEMECIVYGFSSKIAALQFEWAWAKPHLSRHLKFLASEHSSSGDRSDTSSFIGLPLFPSTSMTPGQTRWGKPKRRMARAPSSPNARLLAMRALLRSEPFCGWGLKLAFFTEWSWLAYQRLESQAASQASLAAQSETPPKALVRYSRSGKPLHPLYPLAMCDFSGVDGKRIPLVCVSEQHRLGLGVADAPVKKRATAKNRAPAVPSADGWPESLPKGGTLKSLDACIQDFAAFPVAPPALDSTDLTAKAKRATKTSKTAAEETADEDASDGAEELGGRPATGSTAVDSDRPLPRMRFADADAEEAEWRQFEASISARLGITGVQEGEAMSDYMQTCVQRHIAAQDARTIGEAQPAPSTSCALCREPVDLTQHLEFALCPQPASSARAMLSTSEAAPTSTTLDPQRCSSVFHLSCLASAFLEQQGQAVPEDVGAGSSNTVLPTYGVCPCHTSSGESPEQRPADVALWAEVVRGMYRRSERFERLLQLLVRTGRTLAEVRNPEPIARPTRAKKGAGKKGGDPAGEEAAEEKGKKRRVRAAPATDLAETDAGADAGANTEADTGKETTRKKAVLKKAVLPSVDVIDLT